MGKIRRKFQVEFKPQLVQQIESGLITQSQASRDYQISAGVISHYVEERESLRQCLCRLVLQNTQIRGGASVEL